MVSLEAAGVGESVAASAPSASTARSGDAAASTGELDA